MPDADMEAKHLDPAAFAVVGNEDEPISVTAGSTHLRHRRVYCLKYCCGCTGVSAILVALIVLILAFTVFRVKSPKITLNGVTIQSLDVDLQSINVTLVADVSIKNPNAASFKYGNTTTSVYYGGTVVGVVDGPPGIARAGRTVRMNLTVGVLGGHLLSEATSLVGDVIGSGEVELDTYTRVAGRVKIMNVVKKHVVVVMNCSVSVDVGSREVIQKQQCKRHVSI